MQSIKKNRSNKMNLSQTTLVLASSLLLLAASTKTQATYLPANSNPESLLSSSQAQQQQAPLITPFSFNQNVQENQRASVLCTISSGEPDQITWLKDGQLLTSQLAQIKRIVIKPDSDQSTLKMNPVRLDHAGNYTCIAKNRYGIQSHSASLIVHGGPRWLNDPRSEPIVATRGQTVVIDCLTTGWPRPQQSWQIKSKYLFICLCIFYFYFYFFYTYLFVV